ncbi:uncharacterized protein BXZ73DRAFT_42005 [Epithele typhae]|uniref:uncharacterized protein n=1 Tax=Epithele typhae TaxID=378194 RepID=UPI0020074EBE|nr:uncharacterized protein BXZ73DRAFT_42005 [Epithele typhae]KAH9941303.1 hypothetical protein BXZ73DRAFT_42005 [Epithele typhae]
MFKTAARKIAHNTTMPGIPGLAGKQDLRALQDLITAEKTVLTSLQRLSVDFARASDALRMWGQGEGDDLGDTLAVSNALLSHFATALITFANHETTIREQMKSVRTREENLDELKRRRKSVFADAEGAERKLSKMNPENKNLQQQTEILNRLRDEIRQMDADIMAEEANLGDFKRSSVRSWMGRKFGALLECCEKGVIVGELGKLAVTEISLELTQPGMPRPYYAGHARTEFLVSEAMRSVNEVQYSSDPNPNPTNRTIRPLPGNELSPVPSASQHNGGGYSQEMGSPLPPMQMPSSPPMSPQTNPYAGLPPVETSGFSISQFDQSTSPRSQQPTISEFGTFSGGPPSQPSSLGPAEGSRLSGPRGGRFATFPVKTGGPRPPPGPNSTVSNVSTNPYISAPPMAEGTRAPSIELNRPGDDSFSSSVALALGDFNINDAVSNGASSSAGPPLPASGSRMGMPAHPRDIKGESDFAQQSFEIPPPMYTPTHPHLQPQGLPAGAAPSQLPTAMRLATGLGAPPASGSRRNSLNDDDDGLAYMLPSHSTESLHTTGPGSRRVRFGGAEMEPDNDSKRHGSPARSARIPVPPMGDGPQIPPVREHPERKHSINTSPPPSPWESQDDSKPRSPTAGSPQMARAPSPPAAALSEEHALNMAAAHEVSRELDALMMTTSNSPPQSASSERPPSLPQSPAPPYGSSPYQQRSPIQEKEKPPSPTQPRRESPLQPLNTVYAPPVSSQSGAPMSPRIDGYVRARDRSMPSPSIPPAPTDMDGSGRRPSISRTSPVPSMESNGTPYRTPMVSTPLTPPVMPAVNSMYSLSGGGSTPSLAGIGAGGGAPRTISAAAFRRPPARNMSTDNLQDTSPLSVRKRPLPSSPYPSGGPGLRPAAPGGEVNRPTTTYNQDDDFDISAYTDTTSTYANGQQNGGDGIR